MKLERINIPGGGIHLIATIKIAGKSARFIVDTGASESALCPAWVLRHGLSTVKSSRFVVGATSNSSNAHQLLTPGGILVGVHSIPTQGLLVVALGGVQSMYKSLGATPPDGLLGNDVLAKFGAVLDMKKETLKFKA